MEGRAARRWACRASTARAVGRGGSTKKPDFSNPIKGAETFLAAAKAKDTRLLSASIAAHAPYEAQAKLRPMFEKMRIGASSIDAELVETIYDALRDMKVMGTNTVRSTARLGVIVGRQEKSGDRITRTIEMRREKGGWLVNDIGGPRIFKAPYMRNRNQNQQGGSDSSTSDSSGDY